MGILPELLARKRKEPSDCWCVGGHLGYGKKDRAGGRVLGLHLLTSTTRLGL